MLWSLIKNHFTVLKPNPAFQKQLTRESESLFLGFGTFSRGWLLFAAFFIQLCLGSKYAWSTLNKSIASHLKISKDEVSITLGVAIIFVGLANCFGGPIITRNGPRKLALIGSSLFVLGHLGSALGCYLKNIWLIYLFYGAVGGVGIGITFLCPIFTLQRYFPEKRGFASGFSVGGYGLGVTFASLSTHALIEKVGVTLTFVILGLIYGLVQIPCALLLRFPSSKIPVIASDQSEAQDSAGKKHDIHKYIGPEHADFVSLRSVLTSKLFLGAYVLIFCHQLSGLSILGKVADFIQEFGKSADFASKGVALTGIFNAGGRIVMGYVVDRVSPSRTFLFTFIVQILATAGILVSMQHKNLILFGVSLYSLVFAYGSAFGMLAILLIELFGSTWLDRMFGLTLTAFSLDGAVTAFSGASLQREVNGKKDYLPLFYLLFPVLSVGLLCSASLAIFIEIRKRRMLKNESSTSG